MFDKIFTFIRAGVREAVLGGFQDASDELATKLEAREPLAIEAAREAQTNGKPSPRRKPASR